MQKKRSVLIHKLSSFSACETLAAESLCSLFESKGFSVDNFPRSLIYDYVVIFGTIKNRINWHHLFKRIAIKIARRTIIIETPVVGRLMQSFDHNENFFRVGVNGFFADKGFEYALKNRDNDINKKNFLSKFTVNEKFEFKKNCPIGISLQIPGDASISGVDQIKWLSDLMSGVYAPKNLINANDFIIRTPPIGTNYYFKKLEPLLQLGNISIQLGTNENKEIFFNQIKFLVTLSSTMGVDSILRGVPSVGLDDRSFLRLVSKSTLTDCLNSRFDLVDDYLNILCNTTWTIEALKTDHFFEMVINA